MNKASFDRRLRRTRELKVGENFFLDLHDGGMKRSSWNMKYMAHS